MRHGKAGCRPRRAQHRVDHFRQRPPGHGAVLRAVPGIAEVQLPVPIGMAEIGQQGGNPTQPRLRRQQVAADGAGREAALRLLVFQQFAHDVGMVLFVDLAPRRQPVAAHEGKAVDGRRRQGQRGPRPVQTHPDDAVGDLQLGAIQGGLAVFQHHQIGVGGGWRHLARYHGIAQRFGLLGQHAFGRPQQLLRHRGGPSRRPSRFRKPAPARSARVATSTGCSPGRRDYRRARAKAVSAPATRPTGPWAVSSGPPWPRPDRPATWRRHRERRRRASGPAARFPTWRRPAAPGRAAAILRR